MHKIFNLTSLLGFLISINTSSALANPIIEQAGFIFKFQNCTVSNTSIALKCNFLVQNTKERRVLYVYASSSRAFDTGFNDIPGHNVSLGGREYQSTFSTEFPEETTLKGSITFEKAPEGKLTSLDLSCYSRDGGDFKVKLSLAGQ